MPKIEKISSTFLKWLNAIFVTLGAVFCLMLILAMTSLPFWARYSLAKSEAKIPENTKTIAVMGGGGFPSEQLMMRLWYTVELANKFPDSKIIVTTPGKIADSTSTIFQMRQYLIDHQVDSTRILLENVGLNTRHQALLVYDMYKKEQFEQPLVVVTSPAHVYRSVLCFRKVGFNLVSGKPATEVMLETDLRLKEKKLGGNEYIPNAGNSISLRYKFWDYLKYEVEVTREYIAITYYKLKGWI